MPGATLIPPVPPANSASSALALIPKVPLRLPAVTGPPPVPVPLLLVKVVPPLPTGFPFASKTGKFAGFTAVPVPELPPDPNSLWLPMLNGPRSQSKPSSFRLVWVISMNFASISTCFGPEAFACSTKASTMSRLSAVLRTTSVPLCGKKVALEFGGKLTPMLCKKLIDEAGASLKEKLELGRYALLEGGYITSYLHRSDRALPPTVGVLVQLDAPNEQAGKDVAQQVAAMRPQYVSRDQVPADIVENERRIAEQITRDEGKPEQAIPKIVEGRLGSFFKDVTLVEQAFVKEPKKTIKQMLSEQGA